MSTLGPADDADRIRQLEAEIILLRKELSALRMAYAEMIESRNAWRSKVTLDPDDDQALPADVIKQQQRKIRGLEEFIRRLLEGMPVEPLIDPAERAIVSPSQSVD